MNDHFEFLQTAIPGPRSRELLAVLAQYESRGVTWIADDFPIVWETAEGAIVTDVDGNRYLDLTSAFGVANVGHSNPYVASAISDQASRLMHGMGDVHPAEVRVELYQTLASIAPEGLARGFLANSGSEAVEFALKTAYLVTKKPGVLAFTGSYHGLTLGTLAVTEIDRFRAPFAPLVSDRATFVPFPTADLGHTEAAIHKTFADHPEIGTIILEPIQGRAGVIVPPAGFLPMLRTVADRYGAVLVFDEIYTGFGRTGAWFACEHEGTIPDLMCIGKAIAGGFPLSAVLGNEKTMNAWEASSGEALHTSTFLGTPMGCAAALATIGEMQRLDLVGRAQRGAELLWKRLDAMRAQASHAVRAIRGLGMLWGVQTPSADVANRAVRLALQRGVIALQSGTDGATITVAPPLVMTDTQLVRALGILERALVETVAQ